MTFTHRLLPCPFDPAKSFFNVGIGAQKLSIKPDWQTVISSPSDRAVEPRKAAA